MNLIAQIAAMPRKPIIVAEVKERSPFGFVNPLPRIEQLRLCESVGDVISIHTNELWGGSWEWLQEARKLTNKPILAKGFHDTQADVDRVFSYGIDYVLTVGWWPDNGTRTTRDHCRCSKGSYGMAVSGE